MARPPTSPPLPPTQPIRGNPSDAPGKGDGNDNPPPKPKGRR